MKFKKLFLISIFVFVLLMANTVMTFAATYEWSLASVLPESHPVHSSLEFFAERVSQNTDGEVEITIFAGGQLGEEQDYIEGLQLGTVDMAKVSSAPLGQFSESLQVLSLPFIFRDIEHQHAVVRGPIGKNLMSDLEDHGFKGLSFFDAGFRSVTNTVRPIRKPEDLEGLQIRVMGSQPLIETINAFGATAVPMGQGEVYVALQQGVIDGWENNIPTVLTFNMQEVAEYYSYTRHVSIPDILIMRNDLFTDLDEETKEAIMDAAEATAIYQSSIWGDYVGQAKKELKEKGMIFNEVENIKDFQKVVTPIYEKYGQQIPNGEKLIESIVNYE